MFKRTAPTIQPTAEQLAIQSETARRVIVEANAGAAKTTTLAWVAARAIELGTAPERIRCLTYSEPACDAFRDALTTIGLPYDQRIRVRVDTFERYARSVLFRLERHAVPWHEAPEPLREPVLTAIARVQHNFEERYPDSLELPRSGDALVETFLRDMQHLKGTLSVLREAAGRASTPSLAQELGVPYGTLKVFSCYERIRRGGHPDHPCFRSDGDATYDLVLTLTQGDNPVAERLLDERLELVLLDEMHDTNWAMFTVLRHALMQNPRARFTGVGDRDQVIHAAAGADAQFMGDTFDVEIGPARRLQLTGSYRFGKTLANAAGLHAKKRYESRSAHKTAVQVRSFKTRPELIQAIVDAFERREGLAPRASAREFAVLLRNPHQSIGIESLLLERQIPYELVGFESFLFRPEILMVRGLLAYCNDNFNAIERDETRAAVAKAMYFFGGGKIVAEGDQAEDQAVLLKRALKDVSDSPRVLSAFFENQILKNGSPLAQRHMVDAVSAARRGQGMGTFKSVMTALDPTRLATQVFVKAADVAQVTDNVAALLSVAESLGQGMHEFMRTLDAFERLRLQTSPKKCLRLSSIEASKGLEFDHVIIPFMNKGEFARAGDTVDERNRLYVAMTRAKRQLTFMVDTPQPSQYLRDMRLLESL